MNLNQTIFNAIQAREFITEFPEGTAKQIGINWAAVLQGATITDSAWSCNLAGLDISGDAATDTETTAIIGGAPGRFNLVNTITTSAGETLIRTIKVIISAVNPPLTDYE